MLFRSNHDVPVAEGRQVGRPVKVDRGKLNYARRLRDEDGLTGAEIVERTGQTRSTLYRHLPPRPIGTHTGGGVAPDRDQVGAASAAEDQPAPIYAVDRTRRR